MPRYAIGLGATILALIAFVGVIATSSAQEKVYPIGIAVVDPAGAAIQNADVVFKGASGTVFAHTGMDGFVNANLQAGNYVVTIRAFGFATAGLSEFSVPATGTVPFRVSLKVNNVFFGSGSPNIIRDDVPTVLSELPSRLGDQAVPTPLPVTQPTTTKRRSLRCFYLWRCSAS